MNIPKSMAERLEYYSSKLEGNPKLQQLYKNCFLSTWNTALQKCDDGSYFVLTGDIPAMYINCLRITPSITSATSGSFANGM